MIVNSNLILTEDEIKSLGTSVSEIEKNLTLPNPEYVNSKRFGRGSFYKRIDPYICYLKKQGNEYIVPRYYFGRPVGEIMSKISFRDEIRMGRPLSSRCHVKLRDYQQKFFDENAALHNHEATLMEMPCGHGKTICAIYLAYMRGVQTLVLVPTHYLARQWEQRIKEFTDASVHVFSSLDKEIPLDYDFLIATMDLFQCRELPDELKKNIGHVILDEAHRVGADTYIPVLDQIPAYYRTALTATFRRNDGVHKILKYHFGERISMDNQFPRPYVYALRTNVDVNSVVAKKKIKGDFFTDFLDRHCVPYRETPNYISFSNRDDNIGVLADSCVPNVREREKIRCVLDKGSAMDYSSLDSYLNEHSGRRKVVIKAIEECLEAGRTVLFLSKRKDVLKAMDKYFSKYNPVLIVSETNKRSPDVEEYLQKSCRLILGVTQLAKEGLDIDRLDTLIIHLPMKDTEQAIGRISRLHESKKFPVCLYLLDNHPITYSVFNNAKKFMGINADYKGEISLRNLGYIL